MQSPHGMMGFRRDDETVRGRRIERPVVRRVLRTIRPYRGLVGLFVVCVVAGSATAALPPLLFRSLLDTAIPERDRTLLTVLSLGAVGLAFAGAVFSLVQRWLSARIGEGIIYDLRVSLFDHVQSMPLAFFTRTQTGALQSRLNNDVVGAQQAVTNTLGTVVSNSISIVVTLSIMFALEWRLTILTLLVLPAFIWPARRIGPALQRLFRESMQLNAEMNTTIAERFNVSGAMLVKLFGRPRSERDEFARRAGSVRNNGVRAALYGRVLFVALGFVAAVGTAVVYWVGGSLAIDGDLRPGTVAAFVLYVGQIYQPLAQLTNTRVDVLSALVSFERVFEVLDFAPAITDRPGAYDLPRTTGTVEFDHVWFRHPAAAEVSIPSLEGAGVGIGTEASDWILRDLSFTITPGEFVALVGPSGAGKSTIAALLTRLHDTTQGAVRIDGHDVRDLTQLSLRAAIGVVAQDPHLFHESIAANLRYASPGATDAQLWDALRAAQIDELVATLPDGLATIVGERGYRMSGGEKQRLAIARVLLKDPAIMILDEATSHLDTESEAAIQAVFASALAGRSALVIAHRLTTVVHADRILVVDEGRIVEQGGHDELLRREGLYAQLTRTQLASGVP
jgi:ATP-binding cassette subfamily B protein